MYHYNVTINFELVKLTQVNKQYNNMKNNELATVNATTEVVAKTKKVNTKKSTTAIAVVDNATVTNNTVANKIMSFNDTMSLMTNCGIGSKSHTVNYRIMNGGSSIHVLRSMYRIYVTNDDYDLIVNKLCGNATVTTKSKNKVELHTYSLNDMVLSEYDNTTDKLRPHTLICKSVDTLKLIFNALALNSANKPC